MGPGETKGLANATGADEGLLWVYLGLMMGCLPSEPLYISLAQVAP